MLKILLYRKIGKLDIMSCDSYMNLELNIRLDGNSKIIEE